MIPSTLARAVRAQLLLLANDDFLAFEEQNHGLHAMSSFIRPTLISDFDNVIAEHSMQIPALNVQHHEHGTLPGKFRNYGVSDLKTPAPQGPSFFSRLTSVSHFEEFEFGGMFWALCKLEIRRHGSTDSSTLVYSAPEKLTSYFRFCRASQSENKQNECTWVSCHRQLPHWLTI